MISLTQQISKAAATLAQAGVASPIVDARLLAAHFLGCSPMELLFKEGELPQEFWHAVFRRAQREPLQYILGSAPFGVLDLAVGPGVFIPRPETELLAVWAVEAIRGVEKPMVIDLCTGSGALALSIAIERPDAKIFAVELSPDAYTWAARNIAAYASEVRLLAGDVTNPELLAEYSGMVDLVVSNPPYVPLDAAVDMETRHDPAMAVFGGEDGMSIISPMIENIFRLLRPGGAIGIEHDDSTGVKVLQAFQSHGGFENSTQHQDLAGRDRFVTASKL